LGLWGAEAVTFIYLYSSLRASRGQENAPPLCECCGRIEDLAHILQTCPRTHQQRIARHNRIRDLSIRIKNKEWTVLKEHAIPTTAGIRRPDLTAYEDNNAVLIDLTVVSDIGNLEDAHKRKVDYYNNSEIRNWITSRTSCENVDFGPYVTSWRGRQCKLSLFFLNAHFQLQHENYSFKCRNLRIWILYCIISYLMDSVHSSLACRPACLIVIRNGYFQKFRLPL